MLTLFLISLALMLMLIAAMAVGVIMGRKPISGSCGGLGGQVGNQLGNQATCPCGRKPGDTCGRAVED